jgi:hypothetical protein
MRCNPAGECRFAQSTRRDGLGGPRTGLRLLDANVLDGSQLVLARYAATA